MDRQQVSSLLDAALHACRIGLPLNRFVTINWERAGAVDAQRAQAIFLKRASDWLRTVGGMMAYIWVVEAGRSVGTHIHALLHVPPGEARTFSYRQRRWLKQPGVKARRGTIRSRSIGGSYRLVSTGQWSKYCVNLSNALLYVLKERARSRNLALCHTTLESLVEGKRCAASENVGLASRSRWTAHCGDASHFTANCIDDFDKIELEAAIWGALEVGAVAHWGVGPSRTGI